MEYRKICVAVGGGYNVITGSGLLGSCGDFIAAEVGKRRVAVITDDVVADLYLNTVLQSLESRGMRPCAFVLPAGESSKSISRLGEILEFLGGSGIGRSDCVAALGGGVVGDIAGFAAGCYMRGVRCVQLPTTLLAAVDSSVGGKTAVNLSSGKNLAGLFHQPSLVLCDTDTFSTLPREQLANGMAEAIKTAVLSGDIQAVEYGYAPERAADITAVCVGYKAEVVRRDERENGERRLLNLGHTVGHAIELLSGFSVPHGYAVAAGLGITARASAKIGWSSRETADKIQSMLLAADLPVNTGFSAAELAAAALYDKKRDGDFISLAIPAEIGGCVLRTVPTSELEGIIAAGMEEKP